MGTSQVLHWGHLDLLSWPARIKRPARTKRKCNGTRAVIQRTLSRTCAGCRFAIFGGNLERGEMLASSKTWKKEASRCSFPLLLVRPHQRYLGTSLQLSRQGRHLGLSPNEAMAGRCRADNIKEGGLPCHLPRLSSPVCQTFSHLLPLGIYPTRIRQLSLHGNITLLLGHPASQTKNV